MTPREKSWLEAMAIAWVILVIYFGAAWALFSRFGVCP